MSIQSNGGSTVAPTLWHDLESASRTYKVSKSTLRAYTNKGLLPNHRFGLAQSRRFLDSDLRSILGLREESREASCEQTTEQKRVLAFARVSTSGQSEHLQNQIREVVEYCEKRWGNERTSVIIEKHVAIRSGLNFSDKSFSILLQQITSKRFSHIVIRSRDRMARVAFNLISELCRLCGTEIVVMDKQDEDSQQELIQDVLALSHIASCRLYGKRGNKAHFKSLSEEVVELISSLTLSGFSEREIFKRLQKEGKAVDSQNRPFSISLVRRVRRQVLKAEEVKGVVVNGNTTSPASFESWAKRHLRVGGLAGRRGTDERKIVKAYRTHCEALGEAPQAKVTIRRILETRCPSGPLEVATGKLGNPTAIYWPVLLLRPQNRPISPDKLGAAGVLQVRCGQNRLREK